MDTVEPKSPVIYQPETFGQSSNRYRSCVHSDCKTDSKNSPKLKFARFVLPKQDPIRAQRWVEMLCRKDFGLKDIRPHTILCELHFTNDDNLDHRTNLSLEPKPHRSCPPGFAPKANPVPKEWIDAALRNRENPFRKKVLEYVEQQKSKIVSVPEPKKSETSNEIIVSPSPESKDQESSETNNQFEIANLQNDERLNSEKNAQEDHVQDNNVKEDCLESKDKEVKNIQEQHIQNVLCAEKECASKDLVQDKLDITEESSQVKYVQEKSEKENNSQGECLKLKQVKHVKKKPSKRQLAQWKDVAQRNAEIQLQLKSLQGKTQGKTRVWLPCNICGRVYQSPEELRDHIRVHEKEKKHQCGQCNAYFPNEYNLKTHIANVHERRNPTKENIEFHHEQTQGKLVWKNSQVDLEKTKNEQLAEINGKENYLSADKGTQLSSSRPRKTYSRGSHYSKKVDSKINAKLKLLKKFLDKPTKGLESDVCNNHNGAKLTNQILRKTLSDLLQVQYDIK